jgi:hypothetical protein
MPRVVRTEPIRASASESSYSLTEFTRELPDDACLTPLATPRMRGVGRPRPGFHAGGGSA